MFCAHNFRPHLAPTCAAMAALSPQHAKDLEQLVSKIAAAEANEEIKRTMAALDAANEENKRSKAALESLREQMAAQKTRHDKKIAEAIETTRLSVVNDMTKMLVPALGDVHRKFTTMVNEAVDGTCDRALRFARGEARTGVKRKSEEGGGGGATS